MLVSVLMPVYNGEDYLADSIASILNQTLTDFEFIIVNDGSQDATLDIAHSFNDRRIKIINLEKNQGLISALNIGLLSASGEFLARMDHDDIAHPLRLQMQVDLMRSNKLVICGSGIQPFGSIKGRPIFYPFTDCEIRAVLPIASPFAHPAVMMRTDIIKSIGYSVSAKYCEDYDLWWRLSKKGIMENMPCALLNYRFHSKQISVKNNNSQLINSADISVNELMQDGRYRSIDDLKMHRRALSYVKLDSLDELSAVGEWLHWLHRSFSVESNEVSWQYNRVWRRLCSYQAHLGYGIWKIYCQYRPLSRFREDMLVLVAATLGLGADSAKMYLLRSIIRR